VIIKTFCFYNFEEITKMKVIYENEVKYIIGDDATDNWEILDNANPSYYFFHLSSFPSCYVIMENDDPTTSMLQYGALLCKNSGKYKNLKNLKIDYCKCENLSKGDKVGEVIYNRPRQVKQLKN
jgi:predicted ribosome quality control (RQC) complex YloA/Tae2 family protein